MISIMIVDDERATREGLANYIPWNELGVDRVILAEDGLEAFKLFYDENVDILLCDIRMPNMDGIELCRRIRGNRPDLRIILISAFADMDVLRSAIDLRAVKFVEKPLQRSEIQSIVALMTREIKDERASEQRLHKGTKLIAEQLASEMARGISTERAQALMHHADINISFIKTIQAIVINFIYLDDVTQETLENVLELIEAHMGQSIACFYNRDSIVVYVFNHLTVDETVTDLSEALGEIAECFTAFGKVVHDIEQANESYMTAVLALQQIFFSEGQKYASYEDVSLPPSELFTDIRTEVSALLECSNYEGLFAILEDLHQKCVNNRNITVSSVKAIFLEIAEEAYKHCVKTGLTDRMSAFENYIWKDEIDSSASFTKLYSYVEGIYIELSKLDDERMKEGKLVSNVIKHITQNYLDDALSIQKIAEYADITPNYLCYIFKVKTNKTVHGYITDLRMEHAKQLLRTRSVKIYDVAQRVGYVDSNHFSKLFKKQTGVTPSVYREINIE